MAQPGRAPASALLAQAAAARDASDWGQGALLYERASTLLPDNPQVLHNLALCHFALGANDPAEECARTALRLEPGLWQSRILLGKVRRSAGQMEDACATLNVALDKGPGDEPARIALADIHLNEFGDPARAAALVAPLLAGPTPSADAELTVLMASLYERADSAVSLTRRIRDFSARELRLPGLTFRHALPGAGAPARQRPRIGLISPLFSASPVYFLTIAGCRRLARSGEIVVFNRGPRTDWATAEFRAIATEWHDLQHLPAEPLARAIHDARIETLYDLGGWMDPIALKALSAKPARRQYKWVGGQSVTTGLESFDGWIGDPWQSPPRLQHLYSEPLLNAPDDYASYTAPPYLPKPARSKIDAAIVFANPAKLSTRFLDSLRTMPGRKVFLHRQFRHARARARVEATLGAESIEFVTPASHAEALDILNQYGTMVDTFPYTSGLTAREALALGTRVLVRETGELFCERHTARLAKRALAKATQ